MPTVLIACPGFALADRKPIQMMADAGFTVQEPEFKTGELSADADRFRRMIRDVDALIVSGVEKVPRPVIEDGNRLRMISVRGAGYDNVDLAAATDHGVLVTRNPGTNTKAVADMALGLMLAVARKIGWMDRGMRAGRYADLRVLSLDVYEKTLGIIGLGRIGKEVAVRAKGFDMRVIYHDLVAYDAFAQQHGILKVPLETLLQESDFITLHVPLDHSTRNLLNAARLAAMKPDAVLVNTARGGLIDEEALYRELSDGRLCGYGADVHTKEPPDFLPLLRLDNVVTTPHMAGVSKQALINMSTGSARKVIQYLVKKEIPADVLNPDVLDQ